MLFHKFQKVLRVSFEMPLGFRQWGQKSPPKKSVNVLPRLQRYFTLTFRFTGGIIIMRSSPCRAEPRLKTWLCSLKATADSHVLFK